MKALLDHVLATYTPTGLNETDLTQNKNDSIPKEGLCSRDQQTIVA